jgi:drug/metabolite transporter (DMT)-like permease
MNRMQTDTIDKEREKNRKAIPLILLFSVLVVIGQNLMKTGMDKAVDFNNLSQLMNNIIPVLLNPYVMSGLTLYVFSTGIWLIILSRTSLSFCYPFISVSYVLIVISARIFQGEDIDLYKSAGVTLIIAGVIMLSLSRTGKDDKQVENSKNK